MTGASRSGNADWQTRLRSVATGFGLAIGGFVAANVLGLLVFSLLVQAGIAIRDNPTVVYPVGTVLTGLGFVSVVVLYLASTDDFALLNVRIPTLRDLGWTVLGVGALLAALIAISTIFQQLGLETAQHQLEEIGRNNPQLMMVMIPLAFLVIGPSEELLFRGVIQGVLRRVYRPLPAIAIASVMFGIGHVTALTGEGKGSTILAVLLLGAILGALYEYTDNLVVPSLVHGAYDAIVFVQIYVTATGGA